MNVYFAFILTFSLTVDFGSAVKRYYGTESCGHVLGPDHLTVIEFDKDVEYIKSKPSTEQNLLPPFDLRNTIWHCVIVIRGMQSAFTKRSLGIEWREFHIWDRDINTIANSVESCGKAYVTIYKGSDVNSKAQATLCGKDTTMTFFDWVGNDVTLEFYADFRRDPSYTYPTTPTTPTTVKTCVLEGEAQPGGGPDLPLCTTPKPKKKKDAEVTTTEIPDLYPYPEVAFRVDVTSFDYACNESIPDEILRCNDSTRCLDYSLVCDFLFSKNCNSPAFQADKSDQTRDAPAFCFRKETTSTTTTTTPAPPPPPFPWEAVTAAVGGVLGVLALCWCCWRPGWCIWRLARLRNTPCCNTRHCICFRGPTNCCKCCRPGEEPDDEKGDLPRRLGHGGVFTEGFNTAPGMIYGKNLDQRVGRNSRSQDPRRNSTDPRRNSIDPRRNSSDPRYNSNLNTKSSPNYPYGNGQAPNGMPNGNGGKGGTGNGSVPYDNGYGQDPDNFASDWLKLISGDGAHLREQR